jgi:hypothetical protein
MVLNILSECYLAENQRFGILEFFNRIGRLLPYAMNGVVGPVLSQSGKSFPLNQLAALHRGSERAY